MDTSSTKTATPKKAEKLDEPSEQVTATVFPRFVMDARNHEGIGNAMAHANGRGRRCFITGFPGSERLFVIEGSLAYDIDVDSKALFDEKLFAAEVLELEDLTEEASKADAFKLLRYPECPTLRTRNNMDTGICVKAVFPTEVDDSHAK